MVGVYFTSLFTDDETRTVEVGGWDVWSSPGTPQNWTLKKLLLLQAKFENGRRRRRMGHTCLPAEPCFQHRGGNPTSGLRASIRPGKEGGGRQQSRPNVQLPFHR